MRTSKGSSFFFALSTVMTYVHILDFKHIFDKTFLSFVQRLSYGQSYLVECGPFLFTVLPWFVYLHVKYNGTAKGAVADAAAGFRQQRGSSLDIF